MVQKNIKENKGITLVALVITIIVLLILAGIALSLVIGENGLIAKSKQGTDKYKEKAGAESQQMEEFEEEMSGVVLPDDEKKPELRTIKLLLNVTEDNKTIELPYTNELIETDVGTEKEGPFAYNCTVDWGDKTEKVKVADENIQIATHTYENVGQYTLTIDGMFECLYAEENESIQKALIKVEQWGATGMNYINLKNCINLKEIAIPSKNSFVNITSFQETFYGCSGLIAIPELLFANCPNVTNFWGTFSGCSSLKSIPETLFANCFNAVKFTRTFEECKSLTSIPQRLFANCLKVESFNGTFTNCTSLTGKPIELWNEGRPGITDRDGVFGGVGCYAGCTGLEGYNSIPTQWITSHPMRPPK